MKWEERAELIRACKWVDEAVVSNTYNPTIELLDENNCDYCVHGDDPVFNADGSDSYGSFKEAGRFKLLKRTEGVSTTDIVGRLLLLSKDKERLMLHTDKPMTADMYAKSEEMKDQN